MSSPVASSYTAVPGGTASSRSSPALPWRRARVPRPPGVALKWWRCWKSRSVVWPGSTIKLTVPPRPPSPPSGPPRGTCASCRKVAAPSPPSPARTQIFTRSRNIGAILAWACRWPTRPTAASRSGSAANSLLLVDVPQWIDALPTIPDRAAPHLEVKVRTGRVTGLADLADLLASSDLLTDADGDRRHVVVGREQVRPMGDPHLVTAAVVLPARERDDAG